MDSPTKMDDRGYPHLWNPPYDPYVSHVVHSLVDSSAVLLAGCRALGWLGRQQGFLSHESALLGWLSRDACVAIIWYAGNEEMMI